MRIERAKASLDPDDAYYWAMRVRVLIPIVSGASVELACGDRSLELRAGDAWVLDGWHRYEAHEPGARPVRPPRGRHGRVG